METQRVQMKGVLPWVVCWALRAGTGDFCPALGCSSFFPPRTLVQLICPQRLASWAGSRAGVPVS
jgi:hypothetical protein